MGESKIGHGSYEVGYCRPPQHTRFKPGHSGNPKGRPKGTKNLKTDLMEELAERINVSEGGKPKKLSKQRALVKSLTAKAIKGDARASAFSSISWSGCFRWSTKQGKMSS